VSGDGDKIGGLRESNRLERRQDVMKEMRMRIGVAAAKLALLRTSVAVLVTALCIATAASAQDRYMWTGVRIHDGKREGKAVSSMSETEVREAKRADLVGALAKELAEIRLLANVDRKLEDASKRLDDLWIRTAWELDYPGRMDMLVAVAEFRAELLAKLGRSEEAMNAAQRLLPDEAVKRAAPTYELVRASGKILEDEQRGSRNPRLVSLAASAPPTIPESTDEIELAVRRAFGNKQFDIVDDIGVRAAPALERLVLANPDALLEVESDPLTFLFRLTPARGASFALENYTRGGFFWRKRILRSMRAQGAAGSPWTDLTTKMIEDPEMRGDAIVLVSPFAQMDALSPDLQRAIVRALDGADSDLSKAIMNAIGNGSGRPSIRPVLEAIVQSSAEENRRTAALWMRAYASSEAMLRCVDDKDPEMRRLLASFLTPNTPDQPRDVAFEIDSRAREILAKLALDPDPSVRLQAVKAITELKTPLDPNVYTAFARDRDEKVLAAFDLIPPKLAESGAARESWYLPMLRERQSNAVIRMGAGWGHPNWFSIARPLFQTTEGTRALVGWSLQDKDDEPFHTVVSLLTSEPQSPVITSGPFELTTSGELSGLPAIDSATVGLVYRRAFNSDREGAFLNLQKMLWNRAASGATNGGAMLEIVKDTTADRELRTCAAQVHAAGANVDADALLSLLADPSWSKQAPTRREEAALMGIGALMREPLRSTMLLRVVESKDITDVVGLDVLWQSGDRWSTPLSRAVLGRWLPSFLAEHSGPIRSERMASFLEHALNWTSAEHDEAISKLLVDASNDGRLAQAAIERMGTLRWPEFQDTLGQLARNGSGAAVTALGGYMNDRTVEYLLDAIGRSSNEQFRKLCLNQLEAIRRYQDEKARWATRKGGQQARDEAIAQLLPMLSDGDEKVRSQAILSLATLDAVEQLPKIVQFLKDKSPAVRQAAQQALDRLNAAEAKKP
jgi:hypothetical protein